MAQHTKLLAGRIGALAILLSVAVVPAGHAQVQRVPSGELAVAYRQLEDGKLSEAVFQNWLECSEGICSLTTLTLGQCVAGAGYPKIQRWSTSGGDLSVGVAAPGVLRAEFREAGAVFQLRFGFETNGVRFGRLTSFSGGVTKQSAVLDRVLSWQLVPLRLLDGNVTLRCPASLNGVP
jgi:hypothetical protein